MNSKKEIDDELIVKYISGDASPEEAVEIVDWLREPDNRTRFEYFEQTWNASAGKTKPAFNVQTAWSKSRMHLRSREKQKKITFMFRGGPPRLLK